MKNETKTLQFHHRFQRTRPQNLLGSVWFAFINQNVMSQNPHTHVSASGHMLLWTRKGQSKNQGVHNQTFHCKFGAGLCVNERPARVVRFCVCGCVRVFGFVVCVVCLLVRCSCCFCSCSAPLPAAVASLCLLVVSFLISLFLAPYACFDCFVSASSPLGPSPPPGWGPSPRAPCSPRRPRAGGWAWLPR